MNKLNVEIRLEGALRMEYGTDSEVEDVNPTPTTPENPPEDVPETAEDVTLIGIEYLSSSDDHERVTWDGERVKIENIWGAGGSLGQSTYTDVRLLFSPDIDSANKWLEFEVEVETDVNGTWTNTVGMRNGHGLKGESEWDYSIFVGFGMLGTDGDPVIPIYYGDSYDTETEVYQYGEIHAGTYYVYLYQNTAVTPTQAYARLYDQSGTLIYDGSVDGFISSIGGTGGFHLTGCDFSGSVIGYWKLLRGKKW